MKHRFNLLRWLDRLDIIGEEIPEVVPSVQPVQVLGDASLLVPPLVPATGFIGGQYATGGAAYGALSCQVNAPGGCYIRSLSLSGTDTGYVSFEIDTADFTWGASTVLTAHELGPSDTSSIWTIGEVAVGEVINNVVNPVIRVTAASNWDMEGDLFLVPAGSYFKATWSIIGTNPLFRAVFQDLPAG